MKTTMAAQSGRVPACPPVTARPDSADGLQAPTDRIRPDMLSWSAEVGLPVHILLTKADKLKRGPANNTLLAVRKRLPDWHAHASVQLFSALKHTGVDEARRCADSLAGRPAEAPARGKKNPGVQGGEAPGLRIPGLGKPGWRNSRSVCIRTGSVNQRHSVSGTTCNLATTGTAFASASLRINRP